MDTSNHQGNSPKYNSDDEDDLPMQILRGRKRLLNPGSENKGLTDAPTSPGTSGNVKGLKRQFENPKMDAEANLPTGKSEKSAADEADKKAHPLTKTKVEDPADKTKAQSHQPSHGGQTGGTGQMQSTQPKTAAVLNNSWPTPSSGGGGPNTSGSQPHQNVKRNSGNPPSDLKGNSHGPSNLKTSEPSSGSSVGGVIANKFKQILEKTTGYTITKLQDSSLASYIQSNNKGAVTELPSNSGYYKTILNYFQNGKTPPTQGMKIGRIYKFQGSGSGPSKSPNGGFQMLLWCKGTPEYFDHVVKTTASDGCPQIVFYDRLVPHFQTQSSILLCSVPLDKTYKSPHGYQHWKSRSCPLGYDCVKGTGKFMPDWKDNETLDVEGAQITVPSGKSVFNTRFSTFQMDNNEYIHFALENVKVIFVVEIDK